MIRLPVKFLMVVGGLLVGVGLIEGCDLQRASTPQLEGNDSTIFVNSIGMEFRRIPAGTFEMGSAHGQEDELPTHEVKITEPFYMGANEVTQAQWRIIMDGNPSRFRGPYRPVDSVSWHQVHVFIDRLNQKENADLYRLPTEAEWEYAARGGTNTPFYFGEAQDSISNHAWYSSNSDERSHRVGRKHSNPFGIHDIYGNVWEWVRDAYSPNYYAHSDRVNPVNTGPVTALRVIRGGGWFGVVSSLRSANRGWAQPDSRDSQLGFRIVREIPEDQQ